MKECKFCGSNHGVFVKERYVGKHHYEYTFDGKDIEEQSVFDNLEVIRGKHVYCIDCEKRLMPLTEFEERHR